MTGRKPMPEAFGGDGLRQGPPDGGLPGDPGRKAFLVAWINEAGVIESIEVRPRFDIPEDPPTWPAQLLIDDNYAETYEKAAEELLVLLAAGRQAWVRLLKPAAP